MKSLHDHFTSLCATLGYEYRERKADIGIMSSADDENPIIVTDGGFFCEILDGDKVKASNFSTAINVDEPPEATWERAREWLLYSLMVKAL